MLLGCVWIQGTAFALPDDYVAAVEADVAEFTAGTFNAPPDSPWTVAGAAGNVDDGTADLASFESFLKRRFAGTYILFVRLNQYQKTRVWEDYVKTGDLGSVRSNIFAMRSGGSIQSASHATTNLPRD